MGYPLKYLYFKYFGLCLICISLPLDSSCVQSSLVLNQRPIIGVLAQEIEDYTFDLDHNKINHSYIAASYVKFLEGAGAQVVPILINQNATYLSNLFKKINGLILPGGAITFSSSIGSNGYVDAGKTLLKLARDANDQGDFFPVWGTCLGMELMVFDEVGNRDIMANCNAWNVHNKLKYTRDATFSQIYGKAPKSIANILATQEVTANFHHYCLTPQNFTKFGLDKIYSSLSINYDPTMNVTYISTLEHKKYPFYGVQFHPEKNLYEWNPKETSIPHSPAATKVAQYFADFVVDLGRRSTHKFSSFEEENQYLIYKYSPVFTGADGSMFVQKYYFPL